MSPEEMYGLSRKTGQGGFTLDAAVEKYPALQKYVKVADSAGKKEKKDLPEKTNPPMNDIHLIEADVIKLARDLVRNGLKINES